MNKDKFGIYWDLPESELCKVCGQPDNCGDCDHTQIQRNEAAQLGGIKSFWIYPHDSGIVIFGIEQDSTYPEDNEPIDAGRNNGYIFGKWFSTRAIQGDVGSNHITRCHEIDPMIFEVAREFEFQVDVVDLNAAMVVQALDRFISNVRHDIARQAMMN